MNKNTEQQITITQNPEYGTVEYIYFYQLFHQDHQMLPCVADCR